MVKRNKGMSREEKRRIDDDRVQARKVLIAKRPSSTPITEPTKPERALKPQPLPRPVVAEKTSEPAAADTQELILKVRSIVPAKMAIFARTAEDNQVLIPLRLPEKDLGFRVNICDKLRCHVQLNERGLLAIRVIERTYSARG